MSQDPFSGLVTQPQSLNRWSYGQNNPVNRTDPTGFTPECPNGRCGPKIDTWFLKEILTHRNWVVNEKRKFDRETADYLRRFTPLHNINPVPVSPIAQFIQIERDIQWTIQIGEYLKAIPHKWMNFSYLVPGCPSPGACRNTVTLCGTCVERSELGNFLFGMSARYAGISNFFTYAAGHYYAKGLQKPWDQAIGGVGFSFAELDFVPVYVNTMCDIIRQSFGTWTDPIGTLSGNNPASWSWELVQDETIKGCKPCNKDVPLSTPNTIPTYAGEPAGTSPFAGAPNYIYYTAQIPEGMLDPYLEISFNYLPIISK